MTVLQLALKSTEALRVRSHFKNGFQINGRGQHETRGYSCIIFKRELALVERTRWCVLTSPAEPPSYLRTHIHFQIALSKIIEFETDARHKFAQ
jgi:hypothetical protein